MANDTAAEFSDPGPQHGGLRQPLIRLVRPVHRITIASMDFRENPHTPLDIAIGPPPDQVVWPLPGNLGFLSAHFDRKAQATESQPATFDTGPTTIQLKW